MIEDDDATSLRRGGSGMVDVLRYLETPNPSPAPRYKVLVEAAAGGLWSFKATVVGHPEVVAYGHNRVDAVYAVERMIEVLARYDTKGKGAR